MKNKSLVLIIILFTAICLIVLCSCNGISITTDKETGEINITPKTPGEAQTENNSTEEQNDSKQTTQEPNDGGHEHAFSDWVIIDNATCIRDGLQYRTCSCGEVEYYTIKAPGHDLTHHQAKTPTCTEVGWEAYETCSRCSYTTYTERPAEHKGNWTTVSAPSCTSGGIQMRNCTACGAAERRTLSPLGHSYSDWRTATQATCEKEGELKKTCASCGDIISENLPALGHSGEWEITKIPTCIGGEKTIHCTRCNKTVCDSLPPDYTNHNWSKDSCTLCGEHVATEGLQYELLGNDTVQIAGYTGDSDTVYLPSSYAGTTVIAVKHDAFKNHTEIKNIIAPSSISWIGQNAFVGCSLDNAWITDVFFDQLRDICKTIHLNIRSKITSIDDRFCNCSALSSVTIPNSVTNIEEYAFSHCTSLTSITIPDSVASIGKSAFDHCSGLTTVVIGNGVTRIEKDTFHGCTSLTSIELSENTTYIDEGAFYYCEALTSIEIPNSVTSIERCVFHNCESLTSIIIPTGITRIAEFTFSFCHELNSVTIPETVTSIESPFYGCLKLDSIVFLGTIEQWNNITKSDYCMGDIKIIHCTDGDISLEQE